MGKHETRGAVTVGPCDLSAGFGIPGRIEDAGALDAIRSIGDACLRHRVPAGMFAGGPARARRRPADVGYLCNAVGGALAPFPAP